jgi:hypothetical protein
VLSAKELDASSGGDIKAYPRGMARRNAVQVPGDTSTAFICAACGLAVEGDAYCGEGESPFYLVPTG